MKGNFFSSTAWEVLSDIVYHTQDSALITGMHRGTRLAVVLRGLLVLKPSSLSRFAQLQEYCDLLSATRKTEKKS
jgi:hypothetical protein